MSDFTWLVRDYCMALWKIEQGNMDYEDERQRLHQEIADNLEVNRDMLNGVLHNIEKHRDGSYKFLSTAKLLKRMKSEGLFSQEGEG